MKIYCLNEDLSGKWYWSLGRLDYRTNNQGQGLWVRGNWKETWKQIAGTCQFSLLGISDRRTICRRIRKFLV